MFPPLSHLEVVGSPHTEQHDGKPVVVLRIKVNINQKSQVIEEILSQRKQTMVGIAESIMKEVEFDLKLISDAPCPQLELHRELTTLKRRDAAWFNTDSNLKVSLEALLSLKEATVSDYVVNHYRASNIARSFDIKTAVDSLFACGVIPTRNSALDTEDKANGQPSGKVRMQDACFLRLGIRLLTYISQFPLFARLAKRIF